MLQISNVDIQNMAKGQVDWAGGNGRKVPVVPCPRSFRSFRSLTHKVFPLLLFSNITHNVFVSCIFAPS